MSTRRLLAAGGLAVLAFAYAALELRDLLIGFILGAAIVNATLLVSSININGRISRIEQVVDHPSSLGIARLAGGIIGGGVIIVYAIWIAHDLASGMIALGLFWLFLLLSAAAPRTATPD